MAHFEVRGKEHFEVRGKLPPCAIHDMVDQRWKTARDQRRVQRRMLDIRGGSVETARKMHVVQVFHRRTELYIFAGFNHAQNVQICIVYRDHPSFKRSIICI